LAQLLIEAGFTDVRVFVADLDIRSMLIERVNTNKVG